MVKNKLQTPTQRKEARPCAQIQAERCAPLKKSDLKFSTYKEKQRNLTANYR